MRSKIIFLSAISMILLSASKCNKKSNCHRQIIFQNNSAQAVIFAIPVLNQDVECKLDGTLLNSNEKFEYFPYNGCIENSIGNKLIGIYVVDPDNSFHNQYHPCDSIEYYNNILKYYSLSLQDLKDMNWMITYE